MKNIKIKNFQSHKDTEIQLHPGVNVFNGNSDCGKSSIMRALIWVITNTPNGDGFVSYWAQNKKGKQEEACEVTVDDVTRTRAPGKNCYTVGSDMFEALRGDVPSQVSKKLNLGGVNIQRQLDGPFMLSNTPGENARMVNELVKLTDIDYASSWVSSESRSCSMKTKGLASDIDRIDSQLKNDDDIESVIDRIQRLDKLSTEISDKEDKYVQLTDALDGIVGTRVYDIRPLEDSVKRLAQLLDKGTLISSTYNNLKSMYNEYQKLLPRMFDDSALPDLKKLERKAALVKELESSVMEINRCLAELGDIEARAAANAKETKELESKLSTMACPVCGKIWGNGCHQ